MSHRDRQDSTFGLVRRAQQGASSPREELYARIRKRVERLVSKQLGSRARDTALVEDLVQESLLKANNGLAGFVGQDGSDFMKWLATCVRSVVVDYLRKEGARKRPGNRLKRLPTSVSLDTVVPGDCRTPSSVVGGWELCDRILGGLEDLEPHQRDLVFKIDLLGVPRASVAEELGISDGYLRKLLHFARKRLAAVIRESNREGRTTS